MDKNEKFDWRKANKESLERQAESHAEFEKKLKAEKFKSRMIEGYVLDLPKLYKGEW